MGKPGLAGTPTAAPFYQRFAISQTSFAKGVVTQALELAGMWLNDIDLRLAAI